MKKKILAVVLAAFTFGFVSANAQNDNGNSVKQEQTCNEGKKCCKDKKEGKRGGKKDGKKGGRHEAAKVKAERMNPLYGIELTADQQKKVDNLRAERKAKKEQSKQLAKEERQKQNEAYDAEMKKILTPAQYEQYQANKVKMQERKEKKAEKLRDQSKERKEKKS